MERPFVLVRVITKHVAFVVGCADLEKFHVRVLSFDRDRSNLVNVFERASNAEGGPQLCEVIAGYPIPVNAVYSCDRKSQSVTIVP